MAFKTMLQIFYPLSLVILTVYFSALLLPDLLMPKHLTTQSFSLSSKYLHCIGDVILIHGSQYHLVMQNTSSPLNYIFMYLRL